jgi:hypothetical protein
MSENGLLGEVADTEAKSIPFLAAGILTDINSRKLFVCHGRF